MNDRRIERAKDAYVKGRIDEEEFERRIEEAMERDRPPLSMFSGQEVLR